MDEAAPTFSVIIPTLNAAPDIGRCLDSLMTQGSKEFDVYVIDGGSSDGTIDIVRSYVELIGVELSCLLLPGSSVYEAMNYGIQQSRGKWLYFLGADDLIHDDSVFADVGKRISLAEVDIIYGDVLLKKNGTRYAGEFSLDRLLFECNICHQAMFYRKAIFEKTGPFSPRYRVWADWELNIRCFRHPAIRTYWVDRLIAVYNDASGVSRDEDPAFKRELPVIAERTLREQVAALKSSRSYRLGKALFGWLD